VAATLTARRIWNARLKDGRHDFKPDGYEKTQPGITVPVRERFVVAHFDRMKAPLWVAQLWTKHDYNRMKQVKSQGRPWKGKRKGSHLKF
jgi:hypothetical protein